MTNAPKVTDDEIDSVKGILGGVLSDLERNNDISTADSCDYAISIAKKLIAEVHYLRDYTEQLEQEKAEKEKLSRRVKILEKIIDRQAESRDEYFMLYIDGR